MQLRGTKHFRFNGSKNTILCKIGGTTAGIPEGVQGS
jgi:hypothetical protein